MDDVFFKIRIMCQNHSCMEGSYVEVGKPPFFWKCPHCGMKHEIFKQRDGLSNIRFIRLIPRTKYEMMNS